MDEMQIPDLSIMTKYLDFVEVIQWNMTRNVMLSTLRPYLKKKSMTADEFFPLPIDETWQEQEEKTTEVDKNALEWYKNYIKNYKKDSQ